MFALKFGEEEKVYINAYPSFALEFLMTEYNNLSVTNPIVNFYRTLGAFEREQRQFLWEHHSNPAAIPSAKLWEQLKEKEELQESLMKLGTGSFMQVEELEDEIQSLRKSIDSYRNVPQGYGWELQTTMETAIRGMIQKIQEVIFLPLMNNHRIYKYGVFVETEQGQEIKWLPWRYSRRSFFVSPRSGEKKSIQDIATEGFQDFQGFVERIDGNTRRPEGEQWTVEEMLSLTLLLRTSMTVFLEKIAKVLNHTIKKPKARFLAFDEMGYVSPVFYLTKQMPVGEPMDLDQRIRESESAPLQLQQQQEF